MSAISLKSITGITSITTPAGIDNQLTLHTNNTTERFRIDSSGRLLIGTTTEGHGNADDLTIATTDHTGITLRSATNRNGSVFFSDGTSGADEYRGWIQYTHTTDYLTFGTAANERLRIKSDGTINITTANGNLEWTASSGSNPFIRSVGSGQQSLEFNTGGTERLRIASDGKIGINVTPLAQFHVKGGEIWFGDSNSGSSSIAKLNYGGSSGKLNIVAFSDSGNTDIQFHTCNSGTSALKAVIKNDGNFGVGTNSPTARLDVRRGDADGKIAEFHQSTGYGIDIGSSQALAYISSGYNQDWVFKTDPGSGQVERLRITSGGTSEFKGDVTIKNPGGVSLFSLIDANNNALHELGTPGNGDFRITVDKNDVASSQEFQLYMRGNDAADLAFHIDHDRNVTIPNGKVGIGTDNAGQKLDVVGGNIRVGKTSNGQFIGENSSGVQKIKLDTNGVSFINGGQLVVGGTSSQESDAVTLMSDGEVTAAGFYFSNNIGSPMNTDGFRRHTTGTICIDTASVERLRIDSSGRLLLGTTTEGVGGADEFTINTASGHGGMTIRNDTSSNGNIFFSDGTSGAAEYAGYVQYAHNGDHMVFGTSGGERVRITSDGMIGINKNSPKADLHVKGHTNGWEGGLLIEDSNDTTGWNIHPDNNDTLMIGRNQDTSVSLTSQSATHIASFNDNGLSLPNGKGIDFGATGDASGKTSELLDDYEEGTWTPSLNNVGTINYSHQIGRYTKIGRQVHFVAYVRWNSRSNNGSYNITYSGLPYNNANVGNLNPAIYVGGIEGLSGNNGNNTHMGGNVYNNNSIGQFRVSNTTGSGEISLHGGHGSTGAGYIYWGGSYYVV